MKEHAIQPSTLPRRTLFLRLALLSTLLVLFSVGPCALFFIRQHQQEKRAIIENHARVLAGSFSEAVRDRVSKFKPDEAPDLTDLLLLTPSYFTENSPVAYAVVVLPDPKTEGLIAYRDASDGGQWTAELLGDEWRPESGPFRALETTSRWGRAKGENVLQLSQRIERPAAGPLAWIHIGLSMRDYRESLSTAIAKTLTTVILAALAGIAVSFVIARRITRPIQDLCELSHRIAGGELSARSRSRAGGEIGQLASDMNSMAEKLLHSHRSITAHAAELEERASVERLLAGISAAFLEAGAERLESAFATGLTMLGGHIGCDSASIYLISKDQTELLQEWSWRQNGASPPPARLSAGEFAWKDAGRHGHGVLTVSDVEALPQEASAERASLAALHARSAALSRLGTADVVHGFLIVRTASASCEWQEGHRHLINFASGIFSNALARRDAAAERERLQAQLLQSQKMEAVGKLSGGIAHDFNNMLVPIVGYSDSILSSAPENARWLHEIREIKRAAESAASLTRQLLTFSRQQIISRKEISLNSHIRSVEKMLRRLIGENVQLNTSLENDLWTVFADAGQIDQCLVNLCVNARHAMPGNGGRIDISTVMLDSEDRHFQQPPGRRQQGLFIRLSVADNGCGMSEETLSRIFEPFFSTKGQDGTGLGLSVVHGIVEQHNGWITVESAPGRGTVFHLWLPALNEPKPEPPPEARKPQLQRGNGEHILLVEDEAGVLAFVSAALRQNGYRVTSADCGTRARELFAALHSEIDLVLSDVVLPDASGVELMEEFLTVRPDLKALLSSGYSEKNSLVELVRKRGLFFLHKPYTLAQLLESVRSALTAGSMPAALA